MFLVNGQVINFGLIADRTIYEEPYTTIFMTLN